MRKIKWLTISFLTLSLLTAVILIAISLVGKQNDYPLNIINGTLALSSNDINNDEIVRLNGEWKFAEGIMTDEVLQRDSDENRLVNVPGTWINYGSSSSTHSNKKTGTFYLKILLPVHDLNKTWALYIPDIRSARQIFVNGIEMDSQGKVSEDLSLVSEKNIPSIVYFMSDTQNVEIRIVVSNKFYEKTGGINAPVYFGTAKAISDFKQARVITDAGTAIIYLVFGFIFFILYIHRQKDKVLLAFSISNILSAFLYLTNNELLLLSMLPDLSFRIFYFLQFLIATTNVTLLLIYTRLAIPNQTSYFFYKVYISVSFIYMLVPLLLPLQIQTQLGYWHPLFFLGAIVIIVYSMMKAVVAGEEFSVYLYFSALSLLIVFTINLLALYGLIELDQSPLYFMVLFGLSNAAFLAARHSKAHEKAEKLAKDLQKQDKLKNEFLAKTSHEFRTPLHGIMNIIGLFIEREKKFLKDDDLENMKLVLDISNRLSRLVNDILDMEQMNEGKLRLNYSHFSIEKCLKDIANVCTHVYSERKNHVELEIDENMPLAYTDIDRFKQIMYNLLDNSMSHTQSGTITIQSSMISDRWVIVVQDDGSGIPTEKIDKIFDPYEHFSDIKNFSTGIGLSIVKQLVDYMGGTIQVKSAYGIGTSFKIEFIMSSSKVDEERIEDGRSVEWLLPSAHEYRMKSAEISTPHFTRQNGEHTVLIVDDNFSNLKVMIDTLREDGHNIIAVKNGTEMLQMIQTQHEIDMVLLDLLLPDYSGYDLCKRMRESKSMVELPILILTAAINPEDLQYALSIGANDFIHKPYPVNELRARVNSLLYMKSAAKRSATYEIAFLHAQIKPHFLYNALNTIAEFCLKDPEEACDLIISLSKYLRGTLDFSNLGNLVSIDKELALVKAYLKIEKARFPELKIEFDTEENIDVQLPPMTLQVIVENAVKHGVLHREEGGLVKIVIKQVANGTEVSVENEGEGIPADQIDEIMNTPKAEGSIGLYNVNTRLLKMYGEGLSFSYTGSVWFKVSFLIPDWRLK